MSSPDEFDDFDNDIFQDDQTLAALEAQAMKSSQAPKRHIQPYRHVTAAPKAGPSKPSAPSKTTFGGRKEPGPINTEPRAGVGGFGWEHGGKRSMDGNVERYLAQVNDRQAYWQQGNGNGNGYTKHQDEESYPDVVMTKDGEYGIEVGEVVDKHARPSISMAATSRTDQQKKDDDEKRAQGVAARRAAIAQASQQSAIAGPGPTTRHFAKTTSVPIQHPEPQKFSGNSRLLARSTSAGHHPITRPLSRGLGAGALTPIPSEPSSQSPVISASQGSLARKAALELDDEKRKREATEAELEKVKRELEKHRKETEERKQKDDVDTYQSRASPEAEKQGEDGPTLREQIKALQSEVWSARGEAQQVRRAQEEERNRHLAEVDKMRLKYSDMEVRVKERDKETARQVENIRTQAVFSNHAVHNSAFKPRAASQRPPPTPLRNGSPRGKMNEESFLQRTLIKGKSKAAPSPGPQFGAFTNAFATSPTSRVKRQRTGSVMPNGEASSPVKMVSPLASPSRKRAVTERPEPVSPSPVPADDIEMLPVDPLPDDPVPEAIEAQPQVELRHIVDPKAELLFHIFNYIPPTRFEATFEPRLFSQTVLYRVLNYRPSTDLDTEGQYGRSCNYLLQACGDTNATFETILQALGEVSMGCLEIVTSPLADDDTAPFHLAELVTTINILGLLAKTAWLFRPFAAVLSSISSGIGSLLQRIVNRVYAEPKCRAEVDARLAVDFEKLKKAQNPPSPPAPPKHMTNTQAVLAWTRKTRQATQGQAPTSASKDKEDAPPSLTLEQQVWFEELALFVVDLTEALCYGAGEMDIWSQSELVDIVVGLTNPILPIEIVIEACRVVQAASTFRGNFRSLLVKSTRWPGDDPVLDRVSRLMIRPPPKASDEQMLQMSTTLVRALAMLSIADRDAILLIGQRSLVTPALIVVVRRLSSRLWGICAEDLDLKAHFELLTHSLSLFHHLLFPHFPWPAIAPSPTRAALDYSEDGPDPIFGPSSPSKNNDDDRPQGVDLIARLKDPKVLKEFNGIGHQFISAFGAITFGLPVFDVTDLKGIDVAYMQADCRDVAQDILSVVVEGPEEDAVYEVYTDDKEPLEEEGQTSRVEDEVDEDAYKEVIEHHEESL